MLLLPEMQTMILPALLRGVPEMQIPLPRQVKENQTLSLADLSIWHRMRLAGQVMVPQLSHFHHHQGTCLPRLDLLTTSFFAQPAIPSQES